MELYNSVKGALTCANELVALPARVATKVSELSQSLTDISLFVATILGENAIHKSKEITAEAIGVDATKLEELQRELPLIRRYVKALAVEVIDHISETVEEEGLHAFIKGLRGNLSVLKDFAKKDQEN